MRIPLTPAFLAALWLAGAGLPAALASEKPKGKFYGAKQTVHPEWFKESFLDLRDDVREAAAAGKRVILYFYQDGCPYCNKLVEYNFAQKDIYEKTRKHFDLIAINMWGDREVTDLDGQVTTEKAFARAQAVKYTPTLVFLDEQGKVALRLNGYYPPRNFRLALDYVAGRMEKKLAYADYFRQHVKPPTSGKLIPEPFFLPPPYRLDRSKTPGQRPLAVFFEQKDCDNCELLHSQTLNYPGTRALVAQVDAVQLDMWDGRTEVVTPDGRQTTPRAWARQLGIAFAPSIVFFDIHGKEVARTDAFLRGFHTQTLFDYVLKKGYETQPEFQRYLQARAEHLREQGIDVDIWK